MKYPQIYKLFINGVDVTYESSGEDVTYETSQETLATLTFTLSGRRFVIPKEGEGNRNSAYTLTAKDVVKLLDKVVLYGGVIRQNDDGSAAPDPNNYRLVFSGFVKNLQITYDDSGLMKTAVEAVDSTYDLTQNKNFNVYPGVSAGRSWTNKDTLTTEEIVQGIANDMGIKANINVLYKEPWKSTRTMVQRNESDWSFLRRLAKRTNCEFWTDYDESSDASILNFVSKELLRGQKIPSEQIVKDIVFVYPLRTLTDDFEYPRLDSNEMQMWGVTVEQDISQLFATRRTVTKFDYSTGEDINVWEVKVKENDKEVIKLFKFELDEEKTNKLPPEERDRLQNLAYDIAGGEYTNADIEEISQYFKPAEFYSDKFPIKDSPFMGVTIKATVDGNVNIYTKKNYLVKGIGRYASNVLEEYYYMTTVTHTWGSEGFLTQIELKL